MAGLTEKDVCVLIPAYNEAENIRRVAKAAEDLGFPVLVVDDASTDGTADRVRDLKAALLISEVNEGKGAALRRGFRWVLERDFKAVILMDADGQHDPEELKNFLLALNESDCDMIIGDRMHRPEKMPAVRRATNLFLSGLISFMARRRVPDSQCGYRALRRAVLERVELSTERFETESEMILEAARRGFRIGSIPIRSVYEGSASQIHPVRDTLRFFRFLAKRV
ncbi:MAG: glycosyltransferase family 2 protein [Candidatus Omnitrophica bacterium]|nr:glycosyltransferase family 2 protein [Candidatus Omnitrophota bacterium]